MEPSNFQAGPNKFCSFFSSGDFGCPWFYVKYDVMKYEHGEGGQGGGAGIRG